MFKAYRNRFEARSVAILHTLDARLDRFVIGWLIVAGIASLLRLIPFSIAPISVGQALPYFLVVLAPAASIVLSLRWFAKGDHLPQPQYRLARLGRWTGVSLREAKQHRLFGASGIMLSLLIGTLLNVPVRAVEYLVAMPPIPSSAPRWLETLHFAMTLDVVLFTSLYAIAFVAALRRVPLFPRLLLAIWIGDLAMQLFTAQMVTSTQVPEAVALALRHLLTGNVKKVLISMALWLPYLLLSTRVNVTYRRRLPVQDAPQRDDADGRCANHSYRDVE
jgi:hypothetical protein